MGARNPNNNPTDRILRLLEEMDELSAAYNSLYKRAVESNISFTGVMPRPNLLEFHLEMQRQGNTYLRTRPNVIAARERMRHMRFRDAMFDEQGEPRVRERHRQPIPRKRDNPVMVDSPDSKYNMPYHIDEELAKQLEEDNKMIAEQNLARQNNIDSIRAGKGPNPVHTNPVIMPEHIVAGNNYVAPKDLFSKNKPDAPQED